MPKIAVANTLSNVQQYLSTNGYEVISFQGNALQDQVEAIVLSGENENMMGMMDVQTQVPVINAEGMSAEEVYQQLQQHLK